MKLFYRWGIDDESLYGYTILNIIHYYYSPKSKLGWIRIFGRGIKWKDTRINMLLFSERNGYSKAIQINNWRISYLKK